MKLSDFKSNFALALKNLYAEPEILTFFYRLVEFYLGKKRIDISLNKSLEINKNQQKNLKNAQNRLKNGEPLQYILGSSEFFGLHFEVGPEVLIPRPETEELVEWIITDERNTDKNDAISILDIGTGSGCIAVALAKNLSNATIYAVDISASALKIASKNAVINAAAVNFEQVDVLQLETLSRKHDLIVSNPPYVRESEKRAMHVNVLDHEPETALYVKNNDALLFYRKISELAFNNLKPGGKLYFEINQYLEKETRDTVEKSGFNYVEIRQDLFKNPRMLRAVKT